MNYFRKIIKGVFMGVANIIPGVSGGTMAVSMGIYDDIIYAITHLVSDFKKSVKILLPLAIGMALSLVGLTYVITFLLENYTFQTNLGFIGLILGGVPVMASRVKGKKLNVGNGIVFLIFFALIIGLQLLGEGNGREAVIQLGVVEIIKLFFIGVIASATMVVPGVSGSMILLLIGYYNPILDSIKGFIEAAVTLDMASVVHYVGILMPFGIGVVIGIFAIAKLIEFLLKNYETLTFSGILGLVVASPFAILMNSGIPKLGFANITVGAIALVIGFFVAYNLGEE